MGFAVGIDLGTTNTVVGAVLEGKATTLVDEAGARAIPSLVAFDPQGDVLVGSSARERRVVDPANVIGSVKRLIGRPFSSKEVQEARAKLPFEIVAGPRDATMVMACGEAFAIPEVSAFVLRRAKAVAERALGGPVDRAVITVPANFNDLQRAATKVAAKLAGLDVLRILNEPTAAALAYGQEHASSSERIVVYDLGGGTFDVTVLELSGSVFEVLATAGDTNLGGDDVDILLADRMAGACTRHGAPDPREATTSLGRLRLLAESVKCTLSSAEHADADLAVLFDDPPRGPIPFRLSRRELEQLVLPLLERTLAVCRDALSVARLEPHSVGRAILVGGSTRMPCVAGCVQSFFGKPPFARINPDEVVALGAAIQAHALDRSGRRRRGAASHPPTSSPSLSAAPAAAAAASSPPPASGDAPPPKSAPRAPQKSAPSLNPQRPPPLPPRAAPPAQASPRAPEPAAPTYIEFPKATAVLTLSDQTREARQALAAAVAADAARAEAAAQSSGGGPDAPAGAPPPPRPPVPSLPELVLASPRPPASAPPKGDGELAIDVDWGRGRGAPAAPTSASVASVPPAGSSPSLPPVLAAGPPATGGPPSFAPSSATPSMMPGASSIPPRAPLLIDVTPLSLCVETAGGYADVLIDRNTPVPCDRTRTFATGRDGQTSVTIRVAQGESKRFEENAVLGELVLSDISAGLRGEVPIAVTFGLDVDGILNVRAREEISGRETHARIHLVGAATDAAAVDAMRARVDERRIV
jgi:molecular chaperone DnaK